MKTTLIIALAATLSLLPLFAHAHSGGTDSNGCHMDHKTGTRHCH